MKSCNNCTHLKVCNETISMESHISCWTESFKLKKESIIKNDIYRFLAKHCKEYAKI